MINYLHLGVGAVLGGATLASAIMAQRRIHKVRLPTDDAVPNDNKAALWIAATVLLALVTSIWIRQC